MISATVNQGMGLRLSLLIKRLGDVILSMIILLLAMPIMLLIAFVIKLDSPGPILFKQKRVGLNGQLFEIYKFRTMAAGTPDLPTSEMLKLPSRITKVGAVLRRYSLDEIPQLFNVLKNEMSLVGPRPALYNQTELTSKRLAAGVLRYLPGITGWAQINGRDELEIAEKVEADKWYCDHFNNWLDCWILFRTFAVVLNKRGVY